MPFEFSRLSTTSKQSLLEVANEVEGEISKSIVFMTMHGKSLGNFNATLLCSITEKSDRIFAEAFGLADIWNEVELFHSQIIRSVNDEQNGVDDEE